MNKNISNLEVVKRGYSKLHSKKPTTKELESLSQKDLKKCYKAGLPKKPFFRKYIYVECAVVLLLLLATFKYYDLYVNAKRTNYSPSSTSQPSKSSSPNPDKPSSTTQNNQNNSQSTPSSSYKPYVASVCNTTSIPFKTIYINVSYLYVGETNTYGGTDGSKKVCTADSTGYVPIYTDIQPYDKTIYVGTKTRTTTPPPQTRTYEQAANFCRGNNVPSNSSAWQLCINAYLNQ